MAPSDADIRQRQIVGYLPLTPYDDYATTSRYPSTMGKLSAGPAPDELADDIKKVRSLLDAARAELLKS